jgi:hypothetical protein
MAKLKIPVRNRKMDGTYEYIHTSIGVDGYVNVVNSLKDQTKYEKFVGADEDDRPKILQLYANGLNWNGSLPTNPPPEFNIHQQLSNGSDREPIDDENCSIRVERDREKRRARAKPGRYTISLPEDKPLNEPAYLAGYAQEIFTLYCQGHGIAVPTRVTDPSKLEKAHRFMFGMMMLTRCR